MLFNSIEYFVFFAAVFAVYWMAPHRARSSVLFTASLLFYATWSPLFLIHFMFIILVNYPFLRALHRRPSFAVLATIMTLNFINLALFKYFYFLTGSANFFIRSALLANITPDNTEIVPKIILPLAISFYTFQVMALQVDVYRRQVSELPSLFNFALFISFFPQLIAGPIMRHDQLLPYLDTEKGPAEIDSVRGLALIASGIVKKTLIADYLAGMVNLTTFQPEQFHASSVILGCWFFAFMVYCDFSGYTDFARGSALLLGFDLPVNFRGPFFQISFRDHWQRWHVTLTSWLRDYLYIGLGGNRLGVFRSYFNLFMTFFLGGLWHGAGWGFAIWGVMNGLFVAVERWIYIGTGWIKRPASWAREEEESDRAFRRRTAYNVVKSFILFNTIAFGGIFFNTGMDVGRGFRIIKAIFMNWTDGVVYGITSTHGLIIAVFLFLHWIEYNDYFPGGAWEQAVRKRALVIVPAAAVFLLFYCSWKAVGDIPFVYFQF